LISFFNFQVILLSYLITKHTHTHTHTHAHTYMYFTVCYFGIWWIYGDDCYVADGFAFKIFSICFSY